MTHKIPTAIALTMVLVACGVTSTSESTSTTPVRPTTSAPASTTSSAAPTTTEPASQGTTAYPVSDEWVMDTLVTDVDAAAGGLALDGDGNLYTADFGYPGHSGNTVFKVSPDGSVAEFASSELMDQGTGNWFADDGYLYQSSYGSGHVFRISADGTMEVLTEEMSGPTGIVVTPEGRIFVDDCNRSQVVEVLEDGSVELFASNVRFACPNGLTIDPEGNFYVVHFNNGYLHKITPDGEVSEIHRFPTQSAHVQYHEGSLFVTARVSHLVYRYDLTTGVVEIIAGSGSPGYEDGPGPEATFGRPNAIAIDDDGVIYVNHGTGAANNPTAIRVIRRSG